MSSKDPYKSLGVTNTASQEEIKRAYRRLAAECHPDLPRNKSNPDIQDRMKEINWAFGEIGDPEKRSQWDQKVAYGSFGIPGGGPGPNVNNDFFNTFVNMHFTNFRTHVNRGPRPARRRTSGEDIEKTVRIPLRAAVLGGILEVNTEGQEKDCDACGGHGSKSGTPRYPCTACRGTGMPYASTNDAGNFSVCGECFGAGTTPAVKCGNCRGSGKVREKKVMNVRIPAGTEDGQRMRLAGVGGFGRGGPRGDMFLNIRVNEDKDWSREGKHLLTTKRVSLREAIKGGHTHVRAIDGTRIDFHVPPGVIPGETCIVVRGKGVKSATSQAGDVRITVQVDIPRIATKRADVLLDELSRELERPS